MTQSIITNSVLPLLKDLIEAKAKDCYRDNMTDHENGVDEYPGYDLPEVEAMKVELVCVIEELKDTHKLSQEDTFLLYETFNLS
jgi:hypothetical protein